VAAHRLGLDQASWVIVPPDPVGWAAGSYTLKPKSIALGAHLANAGYMVDGSRQWQSSAARWPRSDQSLTGMRAL